VQYFAGATFRQMCKLVAEHCCQHPAGRLLCISLTALAHWLNDTKADEQLLHCHRSADNQIQMPLKYL